MADEHATARTISIAKCVLGLSSEPWDFSRQNAEAIDAHWERTQVERPKLFNGIVHVLGSWRVEGRTLSGTFLRTDFKSFLYWRETGFPDAGVKDAFGTSLVRSADGAVLLGRQTEGR